MSTIRPPPVGPDGGLHTVEEAEAEAKQGRSLDDAIRADYQVRVQEAAEKLRPSLKGTAVGMTVGVVLGLVTGPLGPVVGVGVGAAMDLSGAIAGRLTYRRSWLAAANDLSRRHGVQRTGADRDLPGGCNVWPSTTSTSRMCPTG